MLDIPLIAGVLPTTVSILGAIGMVFLLARRDRWWWLRTVPIGLVAGAGVAVVAAVGVAVARPFPDPLPLRVLVWIGVAVLACVLAGVRLGRRRTPVLSGVAVVLAVVAVLATSTVKVNAFYGYRPTLASVLGIRSAEETAFEDLPRDSPLVAARAGVALESIWKPPFDMPLKGKVAEVEIPGKVSGFPARTGWVYLPPAYLGSTRAELPVLVLIPGQPGGPQDWLLAGQLPIVLDRFAAAHAGLAPIVIVPDTTGSSFGNPMCIDSRLGNAETYLTVDLPAWEAEHLQARKDGRGIGGFSFGGTCSFQLAVRKPEIYSTFLDISGQAEPTLGDHGQTVQAAFGGDEEAFRSVNPLEVLKATGEEGRHRYAGSAGLITVGREDTLYRSDAQRVLEGARSAGIPVRFAEVPGGHSWPMAIDALIAGLPWIAGRTGLIPAVPT